MQYHSADVKRKFIQVSLTRADILNLIRNHYATIPVPDDACIGIDHNSAFPIIVSWEEK